MKKIITTAGAALALAIPTLAPAAPQASPINDCGGLTVDGVSNITTRNVSCSDARAFAQKYTYQPGYYHAGWLTLPSWRTYWVSFHYNGSHNWPKDDIRATRTNHVIHFQIGPYGVSDGGSGKCNGIPAGQRCY